MIINQSIITDIKNIIVQSKDKAIRAVDHQRTLMYWHIGKRIFEEEQEGKERADYGKFLIKYLSEQLQPEFGSGFSVRQINLYRQFYRTFPIVHTLYAQLSWSQYKLLCSVDSKSKRDFYSAEAIKNNWTVRQLERQIYSNLYERLLVSNDKEDVLSVAKNEKLPSDAKEIIKDPVYLEFLGLKRETAYYEKDLENAIITHLQEFLPFYFATIPSPRIIMLFLLSMFSLDFVNNFINPISALSLLVFSLSTIIVNRLFSSTKKFSSSELITSASSMNTTGMSLKLVYLSFSSAKEIN